MAQYVRHEQCPKCAEVGRDTSRDNLAVYNDGSKWCFSCGHREAANVIALPAPKSDINLPFLIDKLPDANMEYLLKYLTPEEIKVHRFKYAPGMSRHVYYVSDGDSIFYEARSVINNKPKSLQYGEKPFHMLGNPADTTDTLVIVEDILSAIVVGRHYSTLPLFGSNLPSEWVGKLIKPGFPRKIVVWLDSDKVKESIKIVDRLGIFKACYVLNTEKDPKEMGEYVKELVEEPQIIFKECLFAKYPVYGT